MSKSNFFIEHLWCLLLSSNLILATQILPKTKSSYFYILILATQTNQIKLLFNIIHINKNLKKTEEKKCWFKRYNRATYLDQTQVIR